jgi:two-component system response regulator NreC
MSQESPAIRTVLVDDHAVVRSGLRLVLEQAGGIEIVAEAGDVSEAGRKVRAIRPDVLVLDLNLGEQSSLPMIPQLRSDVPETAIVVLTMQAEPEFARQALQTGASGFVLKDSVDEELVQAVRAAARGESYLNPRLGGLLVAEPPAPEGRPGDLTDRELEVLVLLARGHTNAEVGERLFLSARTVETHRAHIQQKLGRTTRAELVDWVIEHDLMM